MKGDWDYHHQNWSSKRSRGTVEDGVCVGEEAPACPPCWWQSHSDEVCRNGSDLLKCTFEDKLLWLFQTAKTYKSSRSSSPIMFLFSLTFHFNSHKKAVIVVIIWQPSAIFHGTQGQHRIILAPLNLINIRKSSSDQ